MASLATREAFRARHPGEGDDELVDALLEDASSLIRAEASTDALWAVDVESEDEEDEVAVPRAIAVICIQVAYRAYSNPDALSSEALGAHSASWRGDMADAMYLSDEEKKTIRRAAGRSSFTSTTLVTPYSGDDSAAEPVLPLE